MNANEIPEKYTDKDGNIDLRGTNITALPNDLLVNGSLDLRHTVITDIPYGLVVGADLNLTGTNITTLPEDIKVGGSLILTDTKITALPDNFAIGGNLCLNNLKISSLPKGLTIGKGLILTGTDIATLPDDLVIGGFLDLKNTKIERIPQGIIVGSGLYLKQSRISTLPDNFIVGGTLDLSGSEVAALPKGLIVGGTLQLWNSQIKSLPRDIIVGERISATSFDIPQNLAKKAKKNFTQDCLNWRDKKYIKRDGIFCEVVSSKGNVYKIRRIDKNEITYLVTNGQDAWSHGDTLKEAKDDLIYKITKRDTSHFENLTFESILSLEDAIIAYRTITGVCSFGVRDFVEGLPNVKEAYSIKEICELTKGQVGNDDFISFISNSQR